MRKAAKNLVSLATALSIVAIATYVVRAAVSLSTTTAYTQNFDGMGIPATATTVSTLPADFRADALTTVRTVGTFAAAGTTTARAGGANLSTTAANGIYSFGAGTTALGSIDRAVGFLASGTATTSGNLYTQLTNTTGGDLSGLTISYNVEKYRNGINAAGFRIQLFYSTDGTSWTSAGSNFLTSFAQDPGTTNSGFATAPGATVPVTNQTLSVAIPNGSLFYLAWNYSVSSGSTVTNAQALAIDDISILGVTAAGTPTNPTGLGSSNPSSVLAGGSTVLTVAVTPGTNATSTGLAVTADLSAIGGSASQAFHDDGASPDAAAGDNIFSFAATVDPSTTGGAKTMPVTITDAQARTGSASIPLTVLVSTPPTGVGSSGSVQVGNNALLTVKVTPGANPASTGIAVSADLSAIGGSATQTFFDDHSNGDVTAGDNTFSFQAAVPAGTSTGTKTLPASITDSQSRSSTANITLTVQATTLPTTVKISQVYGGGGNSGAVYTNDFIEIYNQSSTTPVDLTGWSVQEASATVTTAWAVTSLCPAGQTCILQPGHYYLVSESQGAGGTTPLPTADAAGPPTIPLSGGCPVGGDILDMVGYGTASCFEGAATAALANTTAAIRKGNGCVDTDNNPNDFLIDVPIPRNSASPANSCGGDPARPSGLGSAAPIGPEPSDITLLTVAVTPAATPPSTGITVTGDLSSISGPSNQLFFDDGTHGDQIAGDNVFTFQATVPLASAFGIRSVVMTITDLQGRSATAPITFTVISPTCGVELWHLKTGTDPGAPSIDLTNAFPTTVAALSAFPAPPLLVEDTRHAPAETTLWALNATMTLFKKEDDVDYHIVLQDENGRTMIAEIPSPGCVAGTSPFVLGVATSRAKFDSRFTATTSFQAINVPVQVKGVGFFDFLHGQTGVAPNGIELHSVLDITFTAASQTSLTSSLNPSQYRQPVLFNVVVGNSGSTPTGSVNLLDGGNVIDTRALDQNGQAAFSETTLAVGSHTLTAAYGGDSASAPSASAALIQAVNKADQTIDFGPLEPKTYGDAPFTVSAGTSSGLLASFAIVSGPATIAGGTVTITGAGTVTVRASQAGDGSYNAAPDADASFVVSKASQTIAPLVLAGKTYGDAPFTVSATGGGSTSPVTFSASGPCTASGVNGSTITITGGGSCTITASQLGDGNYNAAANRTGSFTIAPAAASITVSGYSGVYDGHAHGATGSAKGLAAEDLTSLLNLGTTFTDVPGGMAHWTFAGNANYAAASGDVAITISPATLTIVVSGFSGPYDGQPHGASAGATGINGESLQSLFNPGATFTNVPGGTAHWSFAGNADYNPSSGSVSIVITKVTPGLSGLSSPTINDHAGSVLLSGVVGLGALIPTGTVDVTVNSVTQHATVGADGHFSTTLAAPPASHSAYTIGYSYLGDGNFNPAGGSGTLTVNDATPPVIAAHGNVAAEATSAAGAVVTYQLPAVSDNVDAVSAICLPASGASFPMGTTAVTCNATDLSGNAAAPTTFNVIVSDTTKPSAPTLTVDPGVLWPPSNKFVPVTLTAHSTDAVSAPSCSIVSIAKNDDDGSAAMTGPLTANLLAAKIQDADELVYTLTVSCKDAAGNTSAPASINVIVPHNQGMN